MTKSPITLLPRCFDILVTKLGLKQPQINLLDAWETCFTVPTTFLVSRKPMVSHLVVPYLNPDPKLKHNPHPYSPSL